MLETVTVNTEKVFIASSLKQGRCGTFPPALKIKRASDEQLN